MAMITGYNRFCLWTTNNPLAKVQALNFQMHAKLTSTLSQYTLGITLVRQNIYNFVNKKLIETGFPHDPLQPSFLSHCMPPRSQIDAIKCRLTSFFSFNDNNDCPSEEKFLLKSPDTRIQMSQFGQKSIHYCSNCISFIILRSSYLIKYIVYFLLFLGQNITQGDVMIPRRSTRTVGSYISTACLSVALIALFAAFVYVLRKKARNRNAASPTSRRNIETPQYAALTPHTETTSAMYEQLPVRYENCDSLQL